MTLDLVLVAFAFYCVTQNDWSSSVGFHDFVFYKFSTGTVHGFPTERVAPVKLQKVNKGPVVPVNAPSININRLPGVNK